MIFQPGPVYLESLAKLRVDQPYVASYSANSGPFPKLPIPRTSLHGISWEYAPWQSQIGERHLSQLIDESNQRRAHQKDCEQGMEEGALIPRYEDEERRYLYAVRLDVMAEHLRSRSPVAYEERVTLVTSENASPIAGPVKEMDLSSDQEPKTVMGDTMILYL